MKFLPENKKKKNWSVAILIIAVIGIVYINFFAGTPRPTPAASDPVTNIVPDESGGGEVKFSDTRSSSEKVVKSSKLLPFGKTIDDSVLSDPRFLKLKPSPDLEVIPEELGQNNLFGQ